MDFSEGIPPESRTLVVVPTMLASAQNVEDLLEALEVRFLANRDDHLHFGLLTDFRDAARGDAARGRGAAAAGAGSGIEELNAKYRRRPAATASFSSIARVAGIAQERVWMGYERKRGKLADAECAAARRRRGDAFSLDRRRHVGACRA